MKSIKTKFNGVDEEEEVIVPYHAKNTLGQIYDHNINWRQVLQTSKSQEDHGLNHKITFDGAPSHKMIHKLNYFYKPYSKK
jgi:hypothetical protein